MRGYHELDHDGRRLVVELDCHPTWGAIVRTWDKDSDRDVPIEALPLDMTQERVDSIAALMYAEEQGS
jgi:hypothetical protein